MRKRSTPGSQVQTSTPRAVALSEATLGAVTGGTPSIPVPPPEQLDGGGARSRS